MDTPIIRDDALVLSGRKYPSAAFGAMLNTFGTTELAIDSAALQPDENGGENFTVTGKAQLLSQPVAVELYLDFLHSGGFEFQLTATFLSLSLATLHDRNILRHSPFLGPLLSTTYPKVKMIFDSEKRELYFGALNSDTHLAIFTGLSLDHLGFELFRSYTEKTIALNLYATIQIGSTTIETKIEVPLGGGLAPKCWVLKSRSTIPFGSGLQDIIHFLGRTIGVPFDNVFPEAVGSIPTFFLDDLHILLDPAAPRVEFLTFRVKSVRELKIGDALSISKVGLRANITPTQAAPEISLTLFGQIKIKEDVSLDVQVMLPENLRQDNWIFFMSGGVALNGMADIAHLPINTPVNDLHLHPGFLKLDSLELKVFEVDFNPLKSTVPKVVFDLVVYAECELIHDFKLKDPRLSFTAVNPFNQAGLGQKSLTGAIAGTIAVGDINFGIEAEKQERGWSFTGTTAAQSIPIGTMISSIGKKFSVTMPDFLHRMELDNLTLRFVTSADDEEQSSQRATFDCQGEFPIHDRNAKFSLAVDVTHEESYTVELSGELTISSDNNPSLDFKTSYSKNASDNFFTASYSHAKEQTSIRLKDIIGSISSHVAEYVPETLAVDLKYVVLAYDKDKSGNRFLFGMDLGASAKLADVVSHLPLVGQMLPQDKTIGIDDVQILIAAEDFDPTFGGRLADILPPGQENDRGRTMLRKGLKKGINVSATMRFGDLRRPLDLPISGGDVSNPRPLPSEDSANTPDVTSSDNVQWFALQKAFGPVHFNRVGVQYKDGELHILLDAALTAAGLTLSLDGLAVSSPLNKFDPTFHLSGLGIDYQGGEAFEISGAFLRREVEKEGQKFEEYDGAALIKIKQLALSAIGSYAYYKEHPSLFIYSVLDYPIGGPAFFFVTGLVAGFGYNRSLVMPTIERVAQFPLVAQAVKGPSATPKLDQSTLDEALQSIAQYVPPSVGDVFLAVGIKFNSFKTIDSFALLTASFGNHFEMNLLGLSSLVAPPNAGPDVPPVAEAQLLLKASFLPDKGFLGMQAQLTPNSYLLSKDCHLTGGFAFYSWFAGSEHDGDFVLTLGGYHPHFQVPAHYPTVPRLGLNWQVSNELSIKGDAYFALTASALMAGGHLEANWLSGSVHAWFKVGADFLIAWQPYHYEIIAYVDMGVQVTFEFFGTQHITVDVGADLSLWGPEFSGEATIHLWIIAFTVEFGAAASHTPKAIEWEPFKKAFLPKDEEVCSIAVTAGLIGKDQQDPSDLGVINPKHFSLATNAVIPSTAAQHASKGSKQPISLNRQPAPFGIGPMGVAATDLTSTHTITITRKGNPNPVGDEFEYTPIFKNVPTGLWGESLKPEVNGKQFVENALSGFEIRPKTKATLGDTATIARRALQDSGYSSGGEYHWENAKAFAAKPFASEQQRRDALQQDLRRGTSNIKPVLEAIGFTPADLGTITLDTLQADDFLVTPQIEDDGGGNAIALS